MTTAHPLSPSITGRFAVYVVFREVWPDQIDDLHTQCGVCQEFNRLVTCNVYVPTGDGDSVLVSACRCCAAGAALDHPELDPTRDAVIEYAKEN